VTWGSAALAREIFLRLYNVLEFIEGGEALAAAEAAIKYLNQ